MSYNDPTASDGKATSTVPERAWPEPTIAGRESGHQSRVSGAPGNRSPRSDTQHVGKARQGSRREGGEAAGVTLLREPTVEAVEVTAAIPAPVDVPPENPREVLSDSPRVDPLAMVRKAVGATEPH